MRTRLPTANDAWNSRLSTGPAVCASPAAACALLHLTENLRLADDQRIEAGGDAKQVPRGVEVRDVVDVRRTSPRSTPLNSLTNVTRSLRVAVDIVAGGVHLGAIAGREHDRFARRSARGERTSAPSTPRAVKSTRSRSSTGAVRWLIPTSRCIKMHLFSIWSFSIGLQLTSMTRSKRPDANRLQKLWLFVRK